MLFLLLNKGKADSERNLAFILLLYWNPQSPCRILHIWLLTHPYYLNKILNNLFF